MFVFIVVSYAAGHGKECVTERVRAQSADSPLSAYYLTFQRMSTTSDPSLVNQTVLPLPPFARACAFTLVHEMKLFQVQVYVRSRSSVSSHVTMFLLLSCRVREWSVLHGEQKHSPQEGVCISFAMAVVVHMFVLLHMQQVMERSV